MQKNIVLENEIVREHRLDIFTLNIGVVSVDKCALGANNRFFVDRK